MDENRAKNSDAFKRPSNEDKLKELTDKLEDGVKAVRDSAEYKKLLSTMAKFPHYSLNNCMLIAMQKPDATLCQGYNAWKKMGRYVKKGEKGIKIIAPSPYTIQKEVDVMDSNGRLVLDHDGEPVKETKELNLMGFKAENTFDVSQTEGKELPRVGVDELKGSVDKFEILMGALKEISPVPIGFEDIKSGAKGYYHTEDKRIAIQQGMSELQTLKTCIHEITHSMIHYDKSESISKSRKELEAEGTASVVLSFMGYDTSDYSYPYLCGYTTDKDMKELKASLGTIRQISSKLITRIEEKLREIDRERNPEIVADNEPVKTAGNSLESKGDDSPLRDMEGCTVIGAENKSVTKEPVVAERKILGTVRILPDGWGGMRQSLLDNLGLRKKQIKDTTAQKPVNKDTREVC